MAHDFILDTQGLTKEFGGFAAVQNVDLRIRRGHIHALIGPNGAGKTTVFNLLTKFLQPTRGRITFDGHDITAEKPAQIARRGVVRSFQISATFGHMSALENVRVGCSAGSARPSTSGAPRPASPRSMLGPGNCSTRWTSDRSQAPWPSRCRTAASARSRSRPRSRWNRS